MDETLRKARNAALYAIHLLNKPRITRDERKFVRNILDRIAEDLEQLRQDAAK